MSNPEAKPDLLDCPAAADVPRPTAPVEIIVARDVPLGGPRAMPVRRTLPSRQRSLIGSWCFVDHYGPDDVASTGGMKVPPHPHIGLQTVSWLFTGRIVHRDSAGNHADVLPGELNLMTAGRGISHSEISADEDEPVLHGAQLWVALPEEARHVEPGFAHYRPEPVAGPGWAARVFLGTLAGSTSPVSTYTPLLGAEILLDAGAEVELDLDVAFEHGILVDAGAVTVLSPEHGAEPIAANELGYLAPGRSAVRLRAAGQTRLLLLGGPPFGEAIVMWWNFVARSHEEIVEAREEWMTAITDPGSGAVIGDSQSVVATRFGTVIGDHLAPIPAPGLPGTRLRTRR
ncbi:pirin family protein [Nocardioides sp.]|uniref:pirin family protein n=1 Tax=Nocardioides sp. TaxID=35761 RepID=UPI002633CB01|nr:pirin family protein [Nocardioides sp.]